MTEPAAPRATADTLSRPSANGSAPPPRPPPGDGGCIPRISGIRTGLIAAAALMCSAHPGQRAQEAYLALADCAVMNGKTPDLHMLNVIVADMSASLDFYRQLGVVVPDGDITTGAPELPF